MERKKEKDSDKTIVRKIASFEKQREEERKRQNIEEVE